MALRSYLHDVRHLVGSRWWVAWVLVPVVGFGLAVFAVAEPLWGAELASRFARSYGLVGTVIVLAVVALDALWNRFVRDDTDHLVD